MEVRGILKHCNAAGGNSEHKMHVFQILLATERSLLKEIDKGNIVVKEISTIKTNSNTALDKESFESILGPG